CVEGRNPRVSSRARGRHRRGHALAHIRHAGGRSHQGGELRRVRVVDARVLAGADRDSQGVRRTRWEVEVTVTTLTLPTYADIDAAAHQIAGVAHRTPVVTSRSVDARTGAQVFFKCENLQRGGAFKFRGAYNALSRLSKDERRKGVVTFSSG